MKQTQQNIAIAKACGWKYQRGVQAAYGGGPQPREGWFKPNGRFVLHLPNFTGSLDAMHEAVIAVADKLDGGYQRHLREIVKRDATKGMKFGGRTVSDIFLYQATAAQRAEAFLRTLGLWEDDAPANG